MISRTFAHTLQGANLGAILHSMDRKVDFRNRLLLLDRSNGIVDLNIATRLRRAGLTLGVHTGQAGG